MIECDLALSALPGGRVPALEAGVPVVMAVRVVTVQNEVAGELDLVGRVVHVVPGLRRVAQADLQQRRGHDEERHDEHAQSDRPAATPALGTPADGRRERDRERGEQGGGARNVGIPLFVGRPHERPEEAVRIDGRRPEGPGARAEVRDGEQREDAERGEQRPRPRPRDGHQVSAGSGNGAIVST